VANEFRPGHPVVFWIAMAILTFGLYSGAKAAVTVDDCPKGASKHWVVLPPEWVCTSGSIRLTN
jgi:hypothetical protein